MIQAENMQSCTTGGSHILQISSTDIPHQHQNPNIRILERLIPRKEFQPAPPDQPLSLGVVLDTETSGLNHRKDRIKQIGMILFEYAPSDGSVIRVVDTLVQGGLRINGDSIAQFAQGASIVIAHNAKHDRPFVEKLSTAFRTLPWACTYAELDWHAAGIDSGKLSFLAHEFGFFFTPHIALNDCQALLEILSRPMPNHTGSVLHHLLKSSAESEVRIWAKDANHCRDELRYRGYQWGPISRCRYRPVLAENLDKELDWLSQNIYSDPNSIVEIEPLTPFNRFADRRDPATTCQLRGRAKGMNHGQI